MCISACESSEFNASMSLSSSSISSAFSSSSGIYIFSSLDLFVGGIFSDFYSGLLIYIINIYNIISQNLENKFLDKNRILNI